MNEKLIYPEDVEVKSVTIDDATFYYGGPTCKVLYSSEDAVRYFHSNARKCERCGDGYWGKGYILCEACRNKSALERYYQLEEKEPENDNMYSDAYDRYFYGWEDVDTFIEDEEDDITVEDLRLLCVEPTKKRYVDLDELYADDMPEDADDVWTKEVTDKVAELNALLRNHPPISYQPSKYRVKLVKHPPQGDL